MDARQSYHQAMIQALMGQSGGLPPQPQDVQKNLNPMMQNFQQQASLGNPQMPQQPGNMAMLPYNRGY